MTKAYFGFGYDPTESENHFYVEISKETSEEVKIYERFHWDEHEQKITRSDTEDWGACTVVLDNDEKLKQLMKGW